MANASMVRRKRQSVNDRCRCQTIPMVPGFSLPRISRYHSRPPWSSFRLGSWTIGTTPTISAPQSGQGGSSPCGPRGAGSYPSNSSWPRQSWHSRWSGGVPVNLTPQLGQLHDWLIAFMIWSTTTPPAGEGKPGTWRPARPRRRTSAHMAFSARGKCLTPAKLICRKPWK